MQKLDRPQPHFGWKLYFFLLVALTVFGVADLQWDAFELLNSAIGLVGLIGLFGYGWAVRVPGPPRFWWSVGALMAALVVINVAVMTWRGRQDLAERPLIVILAVAFTVLLSAPNAVALLRYGRHHQSLSA